MSKHFLILDTHHLLSRARHVVRGTTEEKIGLSMQIIFNSIAKLYRTEKPDHIVFALDGRSWRKDAYTPYKANRAALRSKQTVAEQNEDKAIYEAFNKFVKFLTDHTNCTILYHPNLEADDLISAFVQHHATDSHHTIVSSDGDFVQLLRENVVQYNAINEQTISINGIVDRMGKQITDKKTKLPVEKPNPEWSIFEKCMRGCTSDNVFSAYPGVRLKGSKNKVGLLEAFADRKKQGYAWNNIMNQTWLDHNGVEHKVKTDYERNIMLCDLTKQPNEIKQLLDEVITANSVKKHAAQVGTYFLKFCGQFDLVKVSENAQIFGQLLSAPYPF